MYIYIKYVYIVNIIYNYIFTYVSDIIYSINININIILIQYYIMLYITYVVYIYYIYQKSNVLNNIIINVIPSPHFPLFGHFLRR